MELELKHLSHYLPYGLKCLNQHLPDTDFVIEELKGIGNHIVWSGKFDAPHGCNYTPLSSIKPILRLLSDIKEKELRFIYFEVISTDSDMYGTFDEFLDFFNETSAYHLPYCICRQLIEWHFDVFGLIEKGLAIDKNKLASDSAQL